MYISPGVKPKHIAKYFGFSTQTALNKIKAAGVKMKKTRAGHVLPLDDEQVRTVVFHIRAEQGKKLQKSLKPSSDEARLYLRLNHESSE